MKSDRKNRKRFTFVRLKGQKYIQYDKILKTQDIVTQEDLRDYVDEFYGIVVWDYPDLKEALESPVGQDIKHEEIFLDGETRFWETEIA